MKAGIERIDENDPARGQEASHQLAESRAVGFAARVRLPKGASDFFGEGTLERLRGCGHNRLYRVAQAHLADVVAGVSFSGRQFVAREAIACGPGGMIHLG